MAVNYGQVAIVPKGAWNAETQYKVNNLVSYDGSSYVAKVQPPVGTLPTDTSYWQVSAAGTKKATADSLGTVMPDGTTTSVGEDGKLSVNTAQQDALGVVKGSDDITVGEDGKMTLNTTFEQATELANIIAGEAIKSVLGKVSKAIAATMSLDENALLKNMISGIDVNDGNKVPSSAYIHSLVERIGMGTALEGGFDNLTAGLNSVNNNLSNVKQNTMFDCNSPKATISSIDKTTLNTPYTEGLTTAVNGLVISTGFNQSVWNGQLMIENVPNPNIFVRGADGSSFSKWTALAKKSDLTALTDIILTPSNSYSFNADYTYGHKRAGWVELQFSLASAFDLNKDQILSIPNGCFPKKQVWFPVYESSGGNVIARGNIVGSNIYINGSNSINGKTKLFGHVVYMSES